MCHGFGEMEGSFVVGGNVMIGVGFFGIDNVHLGEDIVNIFGLWE